MAHHKVDVVFVNQIDGSQTGGFTGYETDKPTYMETIAPTYLRSHFYHTFCAEPANCLQLAAAARAEGLTAAVLDGMLLNLTMEGLRERMKDYSASVYAFSVFHSSYYAVVDLIRALREREPDAVVVTGGNYATLVYREILEKNPDINYVLVGEADSSLPALCRAVIQGTDIREVPGLARRELRGEEGFVIKLSAPKIPDIDEVQPLARDYAPQILEREFSFSMISSRGCGLGTCSFCYLPEYQRVSGIPRWRGKSPERIVDEMVHLRDTFGVDHITFVDEDFIGPRREGTERLVAFADLLIKREANMTWYANALVLSVMHLARKGLVGLLAQSGLRYLFVGIESGSDHILKRFKKGFNVAKLHEVVAELDLHGIRINPGLITFLPESTPQEVRANIDVVKMIRYYDVFVFTRRLVMLPGTEEGCGCSAADPEEEVVTTWSIPDEEYKRRMAIDVDMDPERYFQHPQTQTLYFGLRYYRDHAFAHYHALMRDPSGFTDAHRQYLADAHFGFFYDLYEGVLAGRFEGAAQAEAYAHQWLHEVKQRDPTVVTAAARGYLAARAE